MIWRCKKDGEIPSCFFRDISEDISTVDDFTYEGFADFVIKRKKSK
ncbi:MAG: DUF6485 family protein [Bacillota bacterium]